MIRGNNLAKTFRTIPDQAFGVKPIVRIRDIEAVIHNYLLFKEKADKNRFYMCRCSKSRSTWFTNERCSTGFI